MLTSWAQRDKTLQEKSDIHGQEENGLELFISRRHFGEIKQPTTLNQPQWRALHLERGRKSIRVSRPFSVWNKKQKFTFAQSKRFPPKHNLPARENNSLEQAAFWHEVEVVCCLPTPSFLTLRKHN